jgi:hypothetical protein
MLARIGDGLPDDLLMAKVDAVKKTDGQAGFTAAVAKLICMVNDFHRYSEGRS